MVMTKTAMAKPKSKPYITNNAPKKAAAINAMVLSLPMWRISKWTT